MQRCIGAESEWMLSGCRGGADVVQRREVVQRRCRAGAEMQWQCRGSSQVIMRLKVLSEVLQSWWCRDGAQVVVVQRQCRGGAAGR